MAPYLHLAAVVLLIACSTPLPPARTSEAPASKIEDPAPPPKTASAPKPAAKASEPKPAAKAPEPKSAAIAKASPAAPSAPPAKPALDLGSLEQRLKDTSAIGVLTKLSLKNQVDDLVGRFRSFHEGHRPPTLGDLRPAFELLLMKVLSLLQDHDAALANDINASREALWGVLTDREKLTRYL